MSLHRRRFVLLCQQGLACAVVVAVVAPSAGVVTLDIVAPAPELPGGVSARGALVASEPVAPDVREVRLTTTETEQGSSRKQSVEADGPALRWTALASTSLASEGESAITSAEAVEGYGSIGLTWDGADEVDHDSIALEVRTLDAGTWSEWQEMHYDDDHGPDPASAETYRAGTDAVVVGNVDDVQVRATSEGAALPSDMRLAIIDPGATVTSTRREQPDIDTATLESATLSSAGTGTLPPPTDPAAPATPVDPPAPPVTDPAITPAATLTAAQPEIFSRAQWGADERMRDKGSLRYGKITAGFVHHTVNANNYTAEQVPAIIRGIYAYHTQSRGWSDVGYNFLVDRFGRIWEGRYGGVDKPVVGAHTLNYNESSFAMSAIGNFETAQPTSALLDAYGRLFAWKLAISGVKASSTAQVVNGRTFHAINGHRDAGSTACPGKHLYAQLPAIRNLASSYQSASAPTPSQPPPPPPAPTPLDTDISGSDWPDFVVRDSATRQAFVVRTGGQVGFRGGKRAASGFGGVDKVVGTWDLDGDGIADVLARDKKSGATTFFKGDGVGKLTPGATTKRFSRLVQMVGVGDLDGDGKADVVGKKAGKKKLLLYRGKGNGKFKRTKGLANPWDYQLVVAAGDSNRDGNADLYARDKAGKLWLLRGDGKGGLKKPRKLPGRWAGFDVLAGFGDLTNDGRVDLVARKKGSGRTFVYPAKGRNGFGERFGGWSRFAGVRHLVSGGEVNGPGVDLIGVNTKGYLVAFANRQGKPIEGIVPTGTTFEDTDLVLTVGDWNRDGNADVLTRSASTGDLWLRAGNGADGFAAPVLAGTGFGAVADLRAVGDRNGDGNPDLAGTPSGSSARIFPGNGAGGFGESYAAKGPKNLARSITSKRYDWRLPIGDVDGNGRKDVLVRERRTGTLWLLSGIKGGFDKRQYVAGGFGGFDLAG
ncbi:MAG: FG-GAP-like repeat-containing protein [Nocardioides sp.]